ncbi:hypothetical protein PGIGA_G00175900 [Pangasianodon gigas]|uniref:Uncharacterized protein n=1 Tax=Pangasianodon gigas TaxID=30993 RepID=A0ACC5XWR7_PANGG|nr:hypothetical protein [Pangasianodon gigas]
MKGLYQLGWSFFNSSLYYISNESKNWTESRVDCRERGSQLVIINTMEEQEFISTNFNSTEAWIGLSYSDAESMWKWVDNTILTTAYWLEESPTHYEGYEDCAITTIGSGVFTWNVYPCNYTAFSICEKMIN